MALETLMLEARVATVRIEELINTKMDPKDKAEALASLLKDKAITDIAISSFMGMFKTDKDEDGLADLQN